MSAIEHLLGQPAARVLGWVLLHFLWQGALVGGVTALALAALRRGAADVRYVVATIGLSLMLTLPAVTAVQLWRAARAGPEFSSAAITAPAPLFAATIADGDALLVPTVSEQSRLRTGGLPSFRIESWLPMLVFAWLSGVLLLSLRLMSGWLWIQRLRSHGATPAAAGWEQLAGRLSRRLHIARKVRLLESTIVDVPTVIGWLKPVILLPASALSGLTPHQLEAILAHELAHVRRHDYLVNLLQTLVETLLFYHPAVWWISRRIRSERENCCDDLAVSLCGDPCMYASALADLEELRGPSRQLVMAASGGSLVHRVRRLLGAPTHAGRAPGWLAGGASVFVMLGVAAAAMGTDAFQAAQPRAATRVLNVPAAGGGQQATPPSPEAIEQARATTAAAKSLQRRARLLRQAAKAATWLQDATGQASTPLIAGQTLRAQASALEHAAAQAAALARAQRPALAAERQAIAAGPAAAAAGPHPSSPAVGETQTGTPETRASIPAVGGTGTGMPDTLASTAAVVASAAAIASTPANHQSRMTMSWSNNGQRMEVRFEGDIEFTDDDRDVKRLSPGGSLRVKEGGIFGGFFASHTVEFTADPSGNITRRYWEGTSEKPFDPDGRQWLARYLPRFIRQTAFGASARVARILKAHGPAGVLAEISLIEGGWGKKAYFTELLEAVPLDAATVKQLLTQAGQEIESDFELASLLMEVAKRGPLDGTTRALFFTALETVHSGFEQGRVLKAVASRPDLSADTVLAILRATAGMNGSFEASGVLLAVAAAHPIDGPARDAYIDAAERLGDFEQGRALAALVKSERRR